MNSNNQNSLGFPIPRRIFIRRAATIAGGTAVFGTLARRGTTAELPTLVNSIRSLSNPYHATWNQGGAAFAKSIGAEYVTLVTEGNSEKGIADIRAIIQKTGGNMVLNVDPNDAPDGRPIVDACQKLASTSPRNGRGQPIYIPGTATLTMSPTLPLIT